MSTYSTNLGIELIATGDQAGSWGTTNNTNLGTLIEQAISGYVTQAITDGADTTITIPNGASGVARNMYIECTGALTAARNLVVPANKKLYFIYNNTSGGFAVTVKVSGQTGVSVPNGSKTVLVCNGTDVVNAVTYLASLTTSGSLSAAAFIPTGSTVPANGMYLPAANTLGLSTGTTSQWTIDSAGLLQSNSTANDEKLRIQGTASPYFSLYKSGSRVGLVGGSTGGVYLYGDTGVAASLYAGGVQRLVAGSTGNVSINAPSSGTALAVTAPAAGEAISVTDGTVSARVAGFAGTAFNIGTTSAHSTAISSNGTQRLVASSSGNVTINAPSSGDALTVNAAASSYGLVIAQQPSTPGLRISNGSGSMYMLATGGSSVVGTDGAWGLDLYTNTTQRLAISSTGNVTINAPSSGVPLTVNGAGATQYLVTTTARGGGSNYLQFRDPTGDSAFLGFGTSDSSFQLLNQLPGTLSIGTNNAASIVLSTSRNVTINAPSSGTTLAVAAGSNWAAWTSSAAGNSYMSFANAATRGYIGTDGGAIIGSGTGTNFGIRAENDLFLMAGAANRVTVASTGNVTVSAPSSGVALAVTGVSGNSTITATDGTVTSAWQSLGASGAWFGSTSAHSLLLGSNGSSRVTINSSGSVTIGAPTAANPGLTVTGSAATPVNAVTFSATAMTVDCTRSNVFTTTFTANVTTAPSISNPQDGQTINWFITQDATGSRTMTWPSSFKWPGGVAGVLSTAANSVDLLVATYRSATGFWYCTLSKAFA